MDSELCEIIVDGAPRPHCHMRTQEEDIADFPQPCAYGLEGVTSLQLECPETDLDESFESFYSTETTINRFESLESLLSQNNSTGNLYTSARSLARATSPPAYCDGLEYSQITRTLSDFVTEFKSYPNLLNKNNILTDSQETLRSLPDIAEQNKSSLDKTFKPKFENLSASMSTLPRTTSPAGSEEGEKKKKGLISSFRKSRKSSRKVRDQKHLSEISLPAAFKTDKSDEEQDSRDSESSTPTSSISNTLNISLPNVSKSRSLPRGKGIVTNLTDPVQGVNIERLNGNMVTVNDGGIQSQRTTSLPRVNQKINDKQTDINVLQKNEKANKPDNGKGKLGNFLRKDVKKPTPEIRVVEPSTDNTAVFKQEKGIPKMIKRATSSSPRPDSRTSSSTALAPQINQPIGRSSSSSSINKSSSSINKSSSSINKSEVSATDSSFRSYIQTVQFVKKETQVNASENPVQPVKTETKVNTSENIKNEKLGEPTSKTNTVTSPSTVKIVDPKPQSTEKSHVKKETAIESSKNSTLPKEEKSKTLPVDMKRSGITSLKPPLPEAGLSSEKREHLYKILVIGELGTGKTSIIKRYVHQFFSQHYRATIGVDFALKVLNWDNQTVIRLQLWDIAGQERFGNMTRVYYKEAVGAFVVFDVTRAQTFDAISKWKTDLDTKVTLADGSPIPTVLLANKCDQPKEGVVNNPTRMDDFCRERGFTGWFETSAKENINIDEAARFLVNKILSNEKQGMMMTESIDTDKVSLDGKSQETTKSSCNC